MKLGRLAYAAALALAVGCGENRPPGPSNHVIVIDIDDHGLAGLWMANAPNLKGLIARGTLAFSRVVVPTHSNQNNMAILTGQYPDGDDVPANDWLSRTGGFVSPISVAGDLAVGDYAAWDTNPLRVRGDSLYGATSAVGGRSAYVGELPPFEAGADDVHLSIVGTMFQTTLGPLTVDATTAKNILTMSFGYPSDVAAGYSYDGPPDAGETQTHFTLRDAADYVRNHGLPATMFVWDFVALDDDPTSTYGADGPQLAQIIDDYDDALGRLLTALDDKKLTASTNILFTLDHGKVDTHNQVALGTHGGASADGQMAALVAAQGPAMGLDSSSYALLNEDGDAQIYAVVPDAGLADGAAAQADVTHKLLALIQSGAIVGLDTTRTLTADGAMGTRTFHDFRAASPNQADIVVFPQDDWTLNQVDATNTTPGPFQEHTQFPYGRHGGFSADELYVPLIMAGPAFKSGALLPHPVLHPEVAPTALATLTGAGPVALKTAARGAIRAALAGDPGETIALPADPTTARDVVLTGTGFEGTPAAPAAPATNVVIIDVAGLYEDELFDDATTAPAAAGFRALAAQGTRFEDCWTESRDWPVTEYQMLSGGYPLAPFVAKAEDDPTVTFPPGQGLLLMPPAANRVADTKGYAAWRAPAVFSPSGLYDAAAARGLTTAFIGTDDFHLLHLNPPATTAAASAGGLGAQLAALAAANHLGVLALVAVGGARTADRHNGAAQNELQALAATVTDAAQGIPNALVIITSRGATTIDDPGSDFYGPGSSRHVPLIVIGPGVRVGVVTGEPATPADLPATVLYALGAATTTDVAQGTWATGTPVGGVPQPTPAAATEGHALLRAFLD